MALAPQSVAAFYAELLAALSELGLPVEINDTPNELPVAVPFPQDTVPRAYDAGAARALWRALVRIDGVFKHFRTGFLGKASPVHLFWGS
ncbi:DUF5996 family protein, partial [Mycobacterium tuberculosis]